MVGLLIDYTESLKNLIVWNVELTCCQHEAEKLKPRAVYHVKIYVIDMCTSSKTSPVIPRYSFQF